MDTTWLSLDPPLRAALLLGVVASGDVDRLASLEKTKPAALRDNEKKKYGAANNGRNAVALSDRQKGERLDSEGGGVEGGAETRLVAGVGTGSETRSLTGGETGQGSGVESGTAGVESKSGPASEPSSLDGGFGFDYVGTEVGVSRTRHELARATAGIVHGMAGLQVRHDRFRPTS